MKNNISLLLDLHIFLFIIEQLHLYYRNIYNLRLFYSTRVIIVFFQSEWDFFFIYTFRVVMCLYKSTVSQNHTS